MMEARLECKEQTSEDTEPETEHQEKMDAWIADMKDGRKERTACQEVTEDNPEKTDPNQEMMQFVAEDLKAPMEEATVKSSGTMKKWNRGWHLAAGRHRGPKEMTRGDCESQRRLAAACRKVSRHAAVAWHKGNFSRIIRTQGNFGPRKELAAATRMTTRCTGVAQHKGHGRKKQSKDEIGKGTPKGQEETLEGPGMQKWHMEPLHLRKGRKVANCIRGRSRRQQL
jgi:hypothetical protein